MSIERALAGKSSPLFLTRMAAFIAVAVVLGYLLAPIPNVELVTATCFAAGVCLGATGGLVVGAMGEFLFAGLHPMGSSIGILLLAQMLGMALAGFVGGKVSSLLTGFQGFASRRILFGLGAILTFLFDLLTNLAYPLQAGFSLSQTTAVLAAGIGFAAIHIASNALVFALVLPPVLARLKKMT
ncbi:MAG: hypothetical protein V1784_01105 [bacterium]